MSASEAACRSFAAAINTSNVRRAIALAEAETLTWEQVEAIFVASLKKGLEEVA